jgi:hypothetical protein
MADRQYSSFHIRHPVHPPVIERWRSAAGDTRNTDLRLVRRPYTLTGPAASPLHQQVRGWQNQRATLAWFLVGRVIPGVVLPYTIVRHLTVPKDDKEAVPWWHWKSLVNKANKAA